MTRSSKLTFLNTLTAAAMASCVFTGQIKIELAILGKTFVFPASNLFFALLTFPITDIIADVYGKKEAQLTVWVGFISQLATVVILEICMLMPGDTKLLAPFHTGSLWVLMGSSAAYLTAQFWDVYIFHFIKENVTGEGHLWLRNNVSTFSSQIINSAIFISFVFGISELLPLLEGSLVIKFAIALIDTPFVYLGKYLLSPENSKTLIKV